MFCYHCMRNIGSENVCPYCHADPASENAPYQLRPGTYVGDFLVGNVLGESGSQISYIGYDTVRQKRAVITELYPRTRVRRDYTGAVLPQSASEARLFDRQKMRFQSKVKKLTALRGNESIVDVSECIAANNTLYMASEYLEGVTLKEYLQDKSGEKQKIYGVKQLISALDKLNTSGLVVCDINPESIMVMNDGRLKLFDFSSAVVGGDRDALDEISFKYGYAALELYEKWPVRSFTDVYGICAVLYTCVTEEMPVDSIDRADNDTLLPPSQKGKDIPKTYEKILMSGLALLPMNRTQSTRQLLEQFELFEEEEAAAAVQKTDEETPKSPPPPETETRSEPEPEIPVIPPIQHERPSPSVQLNGILALKIWYGLMILVSAGLPGYLLLTHPNLWDIDLMFSCGIIWMLVCAAFFVYAFYRVSSEDETPGFGFGALIALASVLVIGFTVGMFTEFIPGKVNSKAIEQRIDKAKNDQVEKNFMESVQYLDKKLDIEKYYFPGFYFRDYLKKNSDGSTKECSATLKRRIDAKLSDFESTFSIANDSNWVDIKLGQTTVDDLRKNGMKPDCDLDSTLAAGKTEAFEVKGDSTVRLYLKNNTSQTQTIRDCVITGFSDSRSGDYTVTYRDLDINCKPDDFFKKLDRPNGDIRVSCHANSVVQGYYVQDITLKYKYSNGYTLTIEYDYDAEIIEALYVVAG